MGEKWRVGQTPWGSPRTRTAGLGITSWAGASASKNLEQSSGCGGTVLLYREMLCPEAARPSGLGVVAALCAPTQGSPLPFLGTGLMLWGDDPLTSGSLSRCDFSRVFWYPRAQHGAQLKQALLNRVLAVILLLTCVNQAKLPASSELLGVLIHLYLTRDAGYGLQVGRGAEKQEKSYKL